MAEAFNVSKAEYERLLAIQEKASKPNQEDKVSQRELWEYAKPKIDAAERGIKLLGYTWVAKSAAIYIVPIIAFSLFAFIFSSVMSSGNKEIEAMAKDNTRFFQKIESQIDQDHQNMSASIRNWPGTP